MRGSSGMRATSLIGPPIRSSTRDQSRARLVAVDVAGQRRRDEPGLLLDLALELPGAPAGVAGEDAHAADASRSAGDVLVELDRARSRRRPRRPPAAVEELAQRDHAARADRAADEDGLAVRHDLREVGHRLGGGVSLGRLRTIPTAPSSLCSSSSTTLRRKFGSSRVGAAIRICPLSELIAGMLVSAYGRGDQLRPLRRARQQSVALHPAPKRFQAAGRERGRVEQPQGGRDLGSSTFW